MDLFQGIGKKVNRFGGKLAETGVKAISSAVSSKNKELGQYIGEVGQTVIEASKSTIENVSQFADGTVEGTIGLIKSDEYHKKQGWENIKNSTGKTVRGIGTGLVYTLKSAGITIQGLHEKDKGQIVTGLKDLGKVVAVTTCAVGVIDLLSPEVVHAAEVETRNDHLNGLEHGETGIAFETKTIELPNGEFVTGTFPVFESNFSVVLADEMYYESDIRQFSVANETLLKSIEDNPGLAQQLGLSNYDVKTLATGETPIGYVWHHHEQPGVLQLVEEDVHQKTGHTGGRELWGGGSEYR